jgi:hypothetical protein
MKAAQGCSLLSLHYMRRRLYTFLNLETTVSLQMHSMVAHFEEGSERNLQKEEISLINLHRQNFPHLYDEMTITRDHLEGCQTLIHSQFNIQSCAVLSWHC